MIQIGDQEGEKCNRGGCEGVIRLREVDDCSCHASPPCGAHSEPLEECPECGWAARDGADSAERTLSEIGSLLRLRGINVPDVVTSRAVRLALKEWEARTKAEAKSATQREQDLEEQLLNQAKHMRWEWDNALRLMLASSFVTVPETFTFADVCHAIEAKRDEDAAGWRETMQTITDALGELVTKAEQERDEAKGALAKAEHTQRQIFASLEMAAALVRQLGGQLLIAHGEGQRPANVHLVAMAQLWLQAAARGELPSVPSLLGKS